MVRVHYRPPYNIIVVPHTITKQWEDALDKHTSLKYICVKNKKTMDKFVELFDIPEFQARDSGLVIQELWDRGMLYNSGVILFRVLINLILLVC